MPGRVGPNPYEKPAGADFVLVTDDAAEGMLDIHDRKPVVLDAEDARLWLEPSLTPEQAIELARRTALPSSAFEWHKVSNAMNRAGTEGPQIALPLPEDVE
jgi:putative SOS response-associated peptidase YedK